MTDKFDLSVDPLAGAQLTPDQHRVWNALRGEVASQQAKIQELHDKIRQLEEKQDELEPAILNRPEFNREVARMLAFDERYGGMSSVLYFDFENLESMATRYGPSIANAALREIGITLSNSVRKSDIIGRLGGDEFGVLLMRCDNVQAWRKAESLAAGLQKIMTEIHGCRLDVKVSYGAYTFRDNENLAVGLKEAAQKVTTAKQ